MTNKETGPVGQTLTDIGVTAIDRTFLETFSEGQSEFIVIELLVRMGIHI